MPASVPSAEPIVTFWGATRSVTGSMHQVAAHGQSILLDCGLFQGRRAESHERNRDFPFRPKDIDAVILSHAHIDHCGNLPNLVKRGFGGPIYCTPASRALAGVMLGACTWLMSAFASASDQWRRIARTSASALSRPSTVCVESRSASIASR